MILWEVFYGFKHRDCMSQHGRQIGYDSKEFCVTTGCERNWELVHRKFTNRLTDELPREMEVKRITCHGIIKEL
jgi:hypothetical protein